MATRAQQRDPNAQNSLAYVEPVPNATARNWGGQQGRAAGMTGSLNTKNVGADYLAPLGSPLYAPIGGKIVTIFNSKYTGTETDPNIRRQAVNENYGWGTSLVLQGDDGYFHRLSHMVPNSSPYNSGDRIEAGDQIGQVGQSGNTMGNGIAGGAPHLDWEKYTTKSGNALGTDREYVDPRSSDFKQGGQSAGTRPTGPQATGSTLNRAALSPKMAQWADLIEEKASKYGVPPQLLAGIVDYESGGDPNAGHPTSGATGLGQVMPKGSGQWFSDRPTKQQLLDPDTNLDWSAKILSANYKKFNNNPQSAAAGYLGAMDLNGNPTTAADANGTNGFKYVQEVMGRTEKFTGAPSTTDYGKTSGVSAQAAQQRLAEEQERQMAASVGDMVGTYNKQAGEIKDRITAENTRFGDLQKKKDQDSKDYATILGTPEEKRKPEQTARLGELAQSIKLTDAELKASGERLADARKEQENNSAALTKSLEIASGKILGPEEKTKYAADSREANARASQLETALTMMNRGEPGYEKAAAEAKKARLEADNYTRILDLNDRTAGQKDRELGQKDRALGQDDRRIGLDEWEKGQTVPATVARALSGAGLDDAQAANIWAKIKPGVADLEADTALKGDQGAYQRAMTERVNKLVGPEFAKLVAEGKLAQVQADKALALLPAEVAKGNQDVRQGQAQTGLLQGQTWAQMVDANTKQWEATLKAHEAETWQQVQKVAANPNASDEDIMGAIQAGARNATEAAQVYQTKINQYQQQEASRHNKVDESINIQNADETERNNRYQNLASIQNARANMQNASTSALSSSLGASRRANELSALGMVTGSGGLNRIAMQSGAGASVVNPAIEGLKPFEKDQETLRAGVRDNRLANPNATATTFTAPRATAATAGIGSGSIPKLNTMSAPEIEGVNFKPPSAAAAATGIDIPPEIANIAAPAPAPAAEPAPAPEPEPAPPPEEEEGTGGGKKPGVRVMFKFKPPKAKKSTSVAAKKPAKGRLGTGGGFRVPGRIAS